MNRFKLTTFIFLTISLSGIAQQKPDKNCEINGFNMAAEVRIVEYNADFDVYVSEYPGCWSFEVKLTNGYPTSCCEWKIVEYNGDFTIRLVEYEGSADIVITLYDNEASRAFITKYNLRNIW
jgi:hypothetical protein